MKLYVVSEPTAAALPVIAPVDVFRESPEGNAPEEIEYVKVTSLSLVESVAPASKDTPLLLPSKIVPKEPADSLNEIVPKISRQLSNVAESPEVLVALTSKKSLGA